jgi:hypothetical protein
MCTATNTGISLFYAYDVVYYLGAPAVAAVRSG